MSAIDFTAMLAAARLESKQKTEKAKEQTEEKKRAKASTTVMQAATISSTISRHISPPVPGQPLSTDHRNCLQDHAVNAVTDMGTALPGLYYIPDFISKEEEARLIQHIDPHFLDSSSSSSSTSSSVSSLMSLSSSTLANNSTAVNTTVSNTTPPTPWIKLSNRHLQNFGGVPHPSGMICERLPEYLDGVMSKIMRTGVDFSSDDLTQLLVAKRTNDGKKVKGQENEEQQAVKVKVVVASDSEGNEKDENDEEEMSADTTRPNQVLLNKYELGKGIGAHSDGPLFHQTVAIVSLHSPCVFRFYETPLGASSSSSPPSTSSTLSSSSASDSVIALPSKLLLSLLLLPRSLLVFTGPTLYKDAVHTILDVPAEGEIVPDNTYNLNNLNNYSLCHCDPDSSLNSGHMPQQQQQPREKTVILPPDKRLSLTLRRVRHVAMTVNDAIAAGSTDPTSDVSQEKRRRAAWWYTSISEKRKVMTLSD